MGQLNVKHLERSKEKARYTSYLIKDLKALDTMLKQGLIEKAPIRIGAEQEFCIVTDDYFPNKNCIDILETINDSHFTTEIGRYDLEINSDPLLLKGNCFSQLHNQLQDLLKKAEDCAKAHNTKILLTGILPTLRHKHISEKYMTPKPRYHVLNQALKATRSQHFNIHIKGVDELSLFHNSVMLEACNTSFQTHLQINPDEFVEKYNWAQAISGPALAIMANSPMLFGRELWAETRIAVFTQSIDTRANSLVFDEKQSRVSFGENWETGSVTDIFRDHVSRFRSLLTGDVHEDSLELLNKGEIPKLKALQLHNGTVYKWNRVCYGVGGGKPHLRIECRYIPAGPTLKDEIANMVFWVGLMLGQPEQYKGMPTKMDFKDVKGNFFKAARNGIETEFVWMGKHISAKALLLKELLPIARKGLETADISKKEIDNYLAVIENRLYSHSGSQWLVKSYRALQKNKSRFEARQTLTALMHKHQLTDFTVDQWEIAHPENTLNFDYKPIVKHKMKTKLFVVDENDSLELVNYIMKWKKIHHVPVVNQKRELTGLLSWTDLIKLGNDNLDKCVKDVMEINLVTISQEKSLAKAKKLMQQHKINCLPVVRKGKLLGILTTTDFKA